MSFRRRPNLRWPRPVSESQRSAGTEPPAKQWEHFPHSADIGVRGFGAAKEEAFANAALALTSTITDLSKLAIRETVHLTCEANDDDALLVEWLNAIVFEIATRRMLFGRFRVRINGGRLEAWAGGEAIDRDRHEPAVEVKGATYTGLAVYQKPDGSWVAQCVVDV